MRIIIETERRGQPPDPDKQAGWNSWDVLEWDDQTIMTNPDARGLLLRMVAQSIQEWAEKAAMDAKHKASRLQRDAAKEEVEVEAQRIQEAGRP